ERLEPGCHIVAVDALYGGSRRLFERVRKRSMGLKVSYHDLTDAGVIEAAIGTDTRLIWVETPTNPLLKLVDLERVAAMAKRGGRWGGGENRFATPYIQRPLELGFDLVVHSTTKYLNGHSDMVGGVAIVGGNAELSDKLKFLQNAVGAIQGPFDSFLALRGLKTLALRMERHCASARKIAAWLEGHPRVRRVLYPGLATPPQPGVRKEGAAGLGGMALGGVGGSVGRPPPLPRTVQTVCLGGKPRRGREPDRAPCTDDPRLGARRDPREPRHRRHFGAAL